MNEVLQHWEGYVQRIGKRVVEVVLLDVTAGAQVANEVALIRKGNISPEVWDKLKPGSYVTWKIERTPTSVVSQFGLTPIGEWTQEELDAARAEGERMANALRLRTPPLSEPNS